jgi:23S rRNA pseudouridine2605 synthase
LNLKENETGRPEFTPRSETTEALVPKALRLQVYLAHAGAASRRGGEKLITQGRVTVNGKVVSALGVKVLPGDEVRLDGQPVTIESRLHYLALNKPPGYLCSSQDPQNRPLALDLLPPCGERLYNIGRLDFLSSGLILFTNDGAFAAKISHPSSEIEKEYLVESTVPIPDKALEEFAAGVLIEGILYRAAEIERTGRKSLRVILVEGKNREIRRVFSYFHLHPEKLQRIRIGPVRLGNLPEGESRPLAPKEIESLMEV